MGPWHSMPGKTITRWTPRREQQESVMEEDLLQEPEDDRPKRAVVIIFAVFFEGGLAPLSLLLGWLLGHPPLRQFVWSLEYALWGVVATIPLIALFLAILKWPIGPLARVKHFCENEAE